MNGAARLRRAPIRLKLGVAVIVPLSALVAVTSLEVLATSDELDQVRQQTELALATSGPTGLITALQNERAWPAAELVGLDGLTVPVDGYEETRAATDEAIAGFRADLEGKAPAIGRAYDEALAGLDGLDAIRADIDANNAPRNADNLVFSDSIFVRYSTLLEPFFEATARISLSIGDEDLRHGAGLVDATARQIEVLAQLLNTLASDGSYSGGIESPAEISVVARMRASVERNAHTLRTASGPYAAIVAERFPAALTQSVLDTTGRTVGAGPVENVSALAAGFDAPPGGGYPDLQQTLSAEVERRAGELNRNAEARQRGFVALAAVALAATVALTWGVSRSITRPLRSLTRQAQDMAENRLPDAVLGILHTPPGQDVAVPEVEPVRVRTRDEVVDVADALNTVQDTALHLAVEQAVLRRNLADSFVNLGRRNQNLLGRQLDFITELENRETDPDALANLFRLDHLATRMRRNAESLLVLAGVEPPRQLAAPVSLTDVIRAALGEVEDYQRVVVRDVEPATIGGAAATDLTHILAELIENAIVFSRPHQTVDVRGRALPDGYALAVIDEGTGMPGTEIEAANRRLAGAESFSVAPSKYLGHYVAGHLAIRHGVRTHLESSAGSGITAVVVIPPHLLAYEAAGFPLPTGP
jgi:signal transduction histidine kinase